MQAIRIGFRWAFAAAAAAVIVGSLLPRGAVPPVGLSDKHQHLAAYAVLAALAWGAFPTRRAALWLMLLLPLLAIALEFAQTLVPGRSGEVVDAVAGGLGAYLVAVPMLLRYQRRASVG
jgi:VanZ family protein